MNRAIEAIKKNPGKSAASIFGVPLLVVGLYAGEFKAQAEQSHATSANNVRAIEKLVELEKKREAAKTAREEEQAKHREYLAGLCRAGTLTDRLECARVGVRLE
jgi:hypothetical protein